MTKIILSVILIIAPTFLISQPVVTFQPVITNLTQPVDVVEVNDGSGRLFIVQRTGTIRIWNGTAVLPNPFLDVTRSITAANQEQGLLSLAFHPDYINNGYFFIYYTNPARDIVIKRYNRSTAETADTASGVTLMTIPKPYSNHNGGKLLFGTDGYLYFGTGDGGSGGDPLNNSQNNTVLLGKMLRIDVNNPNPPYYRIPATNPFAGSTTLKQEIIANGLRNPWRWSFDKQTGDMWLPDVGQDEWEEVNVVPAANILNRNYGWKCFEGTHAYSNCSALPNIVVPIFEYPHSAAGGYSITGGYVYRGNEYPALQGYYMFADYATGNGWLTKSNGSGGWTTVKQTGWINHISSFAETSNGTLYAIRLDGAIYKINAGTPLPLHLVSFTGKESGNKFEINWQVQNEEHGDVYIIESGNNPAGRFNEISRIEVSAPQSSNSYTIPIDATEEKSYYRLKAILLTGQTVYSNVISYSKGKRQFLKAYNTGNNLKINMPEGTTSVEIFDAVGRSLFKQNQSLTSTLNIPLQSFSKGIITVRAQVKGEWQIVKVIQ